MAPPTPPHPTPASELPRYRIQLLHFPRPKTNARKPRSRAHLRAHVLILKCVCLWGIRGIPLLEHEIQIDLSELFRNRLRISYIATDVDYG